MSKPVALKMWSHRVVQLPNGRRFVLDPRFSQIRQAVSLSPRGEVEDEWIEGLVGDRWDGDALVGVWERAEEEDRAPA